MSTWELLSKFQEFFPVLSKMIINDYQFQISKQYTFLFEFLGKWHSGQK